MAGWRVPSRQNVKRDFSNGFLVAEIFSRYYDKEVRHALYEKDWVDLSGGLKRTFSFEAVTPSMRFDFASVARLTRRLWLVAL